MSADRGELYELMINNFVDDAGREDLASMRETAKSFGLSEEEVNGLFSEYARKKKERQEARLAREKVRQLNRTALKRAVLTLTGVLFTLGFPLVIIALGGRVLGWEGTFYDLESGGKFLIIVTYILVAALGGGIYFLNMNDYLEDMKLLNKKIESQFSWVSIRLPPGQEVDIPKDKR